MQCSISYLMKVSRVLQLIKFNLPAAWKVSLLSLSIGYNFPLSTQLIAIPFCGPKQKEITWSQVNYINKNVRYKLPHKPSIYCLCNCNIFPFLRFCFCCESKVFSLCLKNSHFPCQELGQTSKMRTWNGSTGASFYSF